MKKLILMAVCAAFYSSAQAYDIEVLVNFTSSAENRYSDVTTVEVTDMNDYTFECSGTDIGICIWIERLNQRFIPSKLKTRIDTMFAEANLAYVDSGVNIRLIPVGYHKYDTPNNQILQFTDSLSFASDQILIDRRNLYKADLVTNFSLKRGGLCGNGVRSLLVGSDHSDWAARGSYTSIGIDCELVLGHEIGHNLSLGHYKSQETQHEPPFYPDGYGHGITDVFSTVMAYGIFGTAPRLNIHSNPDQLCSGLPCGVPNSSNATLVLNKIAKIVSQFGENCPVTLGKFKPIANCKIPIVLPK